MADQHAEGKSPAHTSQEEEDVLAFLNELPPLDVGFPELITQSPDQHPTEVRLVTTEASLEVSDNLQNLPTVSTQSAVVAPVNSAQEEDIFSFMNELPALDVGFPDLTEEPIVQPQDEAVLANPEEPQEDLGNLPVENPPAEQPQDEVVVANPEAPLEVPDNPPVVNPRRKFLSDDAISQFFHLPQYVAAERLNVGETFLKKRAREMGLDRWPYNKFKCLDTVRTGFQEKAGETPSDALELLESETKKLQDDPSLPLHPRMYVYRDRIHRDQFNKRNKMGEGSSNVPIPEVEEPESPSDDEEPEGKRQKPDSD